MHGLVDRILIPLLNDKSLMCDYRASRIIPRLENMKQKLEERYPHFTPEAIEEAHRAASHAESLCEYIEIQEYIFSTYWY
jgi:hypothetical protein